MDYKSFAGKRVLITGASGFKGSWLALWLHHLGAVVSGFSLSKPVPQLYLDLGLTSLLHKDFTGSILDRLALNWAFEQCEPELVIHLAAQAVLRHGYRQPAETWETNAIGTLNVLEACRGHGCQLVIATSDKCYDAFDRTPYPHPFRETDRLGGHDPYSSSKAAAELLVDSWRRSFGMTVSTVRCGNVVGGGDFGDHRLVPNAIKALLGGDPVPVYTKYGVRPWTFVLDACAGYLAVAQAQEREPAVAGAFNIGSSEHCTAEELVKMIIQAWGKGSFQHVHAPNHAMEIETDVLRLDISKAKDLLGWRPKLGLTKAVAWTTSWYRHREQDDCDPRLFTLQQIEQFERLCQSSLVELSPV